MDILTISREAYWNIPFGIQTLMYVLMIASLAIFAYGIYRKSKTWLSGQKNIEALNNFGLRFRLLVKHTFGQARISGPPKIFHFGIFWGFLGLLIGTVIVALDHYILTPIGHGFLVGKSYLFFSFILDILGFLLLIGIFIAIWRRRFLRPETLTDTSQDNLILILFALIVITGFFVEGLRIAGTNRPHWEYWSPIGYGISSLFTGQKEAVIRQFHYLFWICHMTLSVILIAIIPYTKILHIVTAPLSIFFSRLPPRGVLVSQVNLQENTEQEIIEKDYPLGIDSVTQLTWWQLINCEACTQCGVCESLCPAYLTKKPLSPKDVVLKLKQLMYSKSNGNSATVSESFFLDELSSCTTCGACVENCPVLINHLSMIIELRRNLVFNGSFDDGHQMALQKTFDYSNPYEVNEASRDATLGILGVAKAIEEEKYDLLYWLGCSAYFDERTQDIVRSIIRLLNEARFKVGVLGANEKCCGDFARRIGDEGLFQKLALSNIETIKRFRFDKIITHCPHGFNTIKNEYPKFGSDFEVVHHSIFVRNLLEKGVLKVNKKTEEVLYHDPCYLGRYNDIYDSPRELLNSIAGKVVEFPFFRNKSFCCGGGGGHIWKHEEPGIRIQDKRIEQAIETGAKIVATACPFCLLMLEDAILMKGKTSEMRIRDIAELVEQRLP